MRTAGKRPYFSFSIAAILIVAIGVVTYLIPHYQTEGPGIEGSWEIRSAELGKSLSAAKFEPLDKLAQKNVLRKFTREYQGWIEYRIRFEALDSLTKTGEPLAVYLGQIGDVDQTYLNDRLIGSTGNPPPNYQPRMEVFRNYLIPEGLLQTGKINELRVVAYVGYVAQKGIDPTQTEVGLYRDLSIRQYWDSFEFYILKLLVPFLCLFVTVLAMPWMSRKELLRPNLLLLGVAICYFIFGIGKSRLLFHALPMLFAYKLLCISALMGLVCMFVYAIELVNLRTKFFYFLGIAVPAFFATRIAMAPDLISASIRVKEWFSGSIPLLFIIGFVSVFYARKQPLFIRFGLGSLAVVAVNDILVSMKTIQSATIMDFGYCIFIITMMIRQMIETKRGWIDLSLKQSDLQWSEKFLKLSRQVAHDVRNPIGSMVNAVKRLEKSKSISADTLDEISSGIHRLESVSDRLMREYRGYFERGEKTSFSLPKLTLADLLIKQIVDEARSIVPSHVAIDTFDFPAVPNIWAVIDTNDFSSAVANILRNAVEVLNNQAEGKIRVLLSSSKNEFRLLIEDNGPGIPRELLAKVFDEGFSFGKKNGTGLGLAQAKKAIEQDEGKINIESTTGKGTKVEITLPREKQPAFVIDALQINPQDQIFLLESDPLMIDIWKTKLQACQINLRVVDNSNGLPAVLDQRAIVITSADEGIDQRLEDLSKSGVIDDLILYARKFDDTVLQEQVKQIRAKLLPRALIQSFKIESVTKKSKSSLSPDQQTSTQKSQTDLTPLV